MGNVPAQHIARRYLRTMPKPLLKEGYSFYFWSEEGSEPPHVHVSKGDGNSKWWLVPTVRIEYAYNFKKQEQRRIREPAYRRQAHRRTP